MSLGATDIAGFRLGLSAVSRLYLGTALVWQDEALPPAGIAAFGDGIGYGADIISVSASEIEFWGQEGIDASGNYPSRRALSMRITGAGGLTTQFRWKDRASVSVTRFFRFSDITTDAAEAATNIVNSGADTIITFPTPHPEGTFYVSSVAPYTWQRWQAKTSEWIANPLTSPTDSALNPAAAGEEAYVIGIAAGGMLDITGKRTLPEVRAKAFKIGTGPLRMQLDGGIHGAETWSSYGFEGYVEWLLGSSAAAIAARAAATWYCYPALNFWGLIANVDRSTGDDTPSQPRDSNRIWDETLAGLNPAMRALYLAAWAIDCGPQKFSVTLNFHNRGAGSNYEIRRSGGSFAGRTSREVAVQDAIVAASPGTTTSVSSVGPSALGAMMSRQFTGTQFAAMIVEGNPAAGIAGWRNFGAAIPQGIMTRVNAGDFALNLPDDPPPVGFTLTPTVDGATFENLPALDPFTTVTPTADGATMEP